MASKGMYQTSKGYACPGPSAGIKHQREIHGPSCCSVFTVVDLFQKIPLLIESTLSYDDIQWCVAAGSTHVSHSVDALDGYVFIVHDSVGFSQICGGSGGMYSRKITDITICTIYS